MGYGASAGHSNCIVITPSGGEGVSETTATHQGILGSSNANGYIDNWYFNGVTHTSAYSVVLNACGGSGTNNAGANLTLQPGIGTGNVATGGDFIVKTCPTVGASGTTAQTPAQTFAVKKSGSIEVLKEINTTAGDAATIDKVAGRFRKDNSGTTFTLTNALITANSIIMLTPANAAIDATATTWTTAAGAGSATIEFNAAPTANFDMNFIVIN